MHCNSCTAEFCYTPQITFAAVKRFIGDDMFNKSYKAECIHTKNCARPHVLNAAVDHVQGDDYPVYSDHVGFYYNNVGQRVMCEETVGKLYYIRFISQDMSPIQTPSDRCPRKMSHTTHPLRKTPPIRCRTDRYNFQGCEQSPQRV